MEGLKKAQCEMMTKTERLERIFRDTLLLCVLALDFLRRKRMDFKMKLARTN